MDFDLTDDQRALQALCRDFARKEIVPHREEWNGAHRFPVEVFRKMADLGLMGLLVPERYGGTGVGAVAYVAAMEEIGKADQSVAATWNAHLTIGSLPFLHFGTEAQKQRWLVPLARGEKLGAFGLTEPAAGSDARGIQTTARRDGDGWVIDGTKMFTSNAGTEISQGVVLLAVSRAPADGGREYSAFMVERDTPGFRLVRNLGKIGWDATDTRELVFEVVERLGPDGTAERPLDVEQARGVIDQVARSGVPSVVICLLHSYVNPEHEVALEKLLLHVAPNVRVSRSSLVSPRLGEYARACTTALRSASTNRISMLSVPAAVI